MNYTSKNPGVSLIIAIIFVSVFMLMMANMTQVHLTTMRNISNSRTDTKVKNLRDAAEEIGKLWAERNRDGQNTADLKGTNPTLQLQQQWQQYTDSLFRMAQELGVTNCADIDNDATNGKQPCVGFEVVARSKPGTATYTPGVDSIDGRQVVFPSGSNSFYYSSPIRGSGDAGRDCDRVFGNALQDADHPCNWNKLYLSDAVEIPLYYVDASGAVVKADNTNGFDLKVRIRPPCSTNQGSMPNSTDFTGYTLENPPANCNTRLMLYPLLSYAANAPFGDPVKDPVLVHWIISDSAPNGSRESLIASDKIEVGKRHTRPYENTEISGGRIQNAFTGNAGLNNSVILQDVNPGNTPEQYNGKIVSNAPGDPQPMRISEYLSKPTVLQPLLRLTLVTQPQKEADGLAITNPPPPAKDPNESRNDSELNLPYLEYQVLSGKDPISDSKSFIKGYAQVGDFRREFTAISKRPTTLGGFAFESF